MQFAENFQVNWQEHCFIITMPDPIQPEQPRIELNNYGASFFNILLAARTWPLMSSICLARKKPPRRKGFVNDEEVEKEVWKWLRQQLKDFIFAGFDTRVEMRQVYQCRWRICGEINVFFSGSNITCFTFYIYL
jgi:hypothetical protein